MYVVYNQSSTSRQFRIRPTIIVLEVTSLEKDIKSKLFLIAQVTSYGRPCQLTGEVPSRGKRTSAALIVPWSSISRESIALNR